MLLSKYAAKKFLKVDDVRDGPLSLIIDHAEVGTYDKPDLYFTDGSVLSLHSTNCGILFRAYGDDARNLIGKQVRLELGQIKYQGKLTETIMVVPISPPTPPEARTPSEPQPPKPNGAGHRRDMDDEIPF